MIEDFRVDTAEYLPGHLKRIDEYKAISACIDVWIKRSGISSTSEMTDSKCRHNR